MKRTNSSTVRTALHTMRMYMIAHANAGHDATAKLVTNEIDVIQETVEDDDLGDVRDASERDVERNDRETHEAPQS